MRKIAPSHSLVDFQSTSLDFPEPTGVGPVIREPQELVLPLELGDIFCRSFVGRHASLIVSVFLHFGLFITLSWLLIPAGNEPPQLVLEALLIEATPELIVEVLPDLPTPSEIVTPVEELPIAPPEEIDEAPILEPPVSGNTKPTQEETSSKADSSKPAMPRKEPAPKETAARIEPSADFFGTRVKGKKFVYILDKSGSMDTDVKTLDKTRFQVASDELMRSVNQLSPDQSFYVILFATHTHLLLDDKSANPRLLPATAQNKSKLKRWLSEQRPVGGTDPREGIELANKMKPNSVFLLSDGEFNSASSALEVVKNEFATVPINTIAFVNESASEQLQTLSLLTGGAFRYVESGRPTPLPDVLLSHQRNRELDWAHRYSMATLTAIPSAFAESGSDHRERGFQLLQRLSFQSFSDDEARAMPRQDWEEFWSRANIIRERCELMKLDPTAVQLGEPVDLKVLYLLKNSNVSVASIQPTIKGSLDLDRKASVVVRKLNLLVSIFQDTTPSLQQRRAWIEALEKVNGKPLRNREEFLESFDAPTWQATIDRVNRTRELTARRLYRNYLKVNDPEKRQRWLNKLLDSYDGTSCVNEIKLGSDQ